jgi:hypothetical protein
MMYVPNLSYLRHLFMDEFHRRPYVGHPGYHKMVKKVTQLYYCSRMKQYIAQYTAKCLECQEVKVEHRRHAGLLLPLSISEWKWEMVSMDFIIDIPRKIKQHDVIMVVVDKLSKEAHFIPIKSTFKAIDVANVFMKEIFQLHGFPKTIISDRDAKFTSHFWKSMFTGL